MRHALLVSAVLGLAGLAHAQTTTPSPVELKLALGNVTDANLGRETLAIGPDDCGATVTVFWTATAAACPGDTLRLWVTSKTSCDTAPAADDLKLANETIPASGERRGEGTFEVKSLPGFATQGLTCGGAGEVPHRVCGAVRNANLGGVGCDVNATVLTDQTPPTLTYDTVAPAAPTLVSLKPGNGRLTAKVEALASDATGVRLAWTPVGSAADGGADADAGAAAAGEKDFLATDALTLEGLTNGVTYAVTARALDEAGNASEASAPLEGTPVMSLGYCDVVTDADGKSVCTQGCSSAGGGVVGAGLVVLMLGGALLARRRVS